ncbi:MAG: beta-lactamase family protein, partial [Firmicutes bacterium]|nr:beta-lactamase family protein [Bacillota bacterium]
MERRNRYRGLLIGLLSFLLCGGISAAGTVAPARAAGSPVIRDGEKGKDWTISPIPGSHGWDDPGPSSGMLHVGTAAAAGMRQAPLDALDEAVQSAIDAHVTPGAVVLIARRGVVVKEQAYGDAARYLDDRFTPMAHPLPMRTDTLFDLASLSKLFTATAVMQLYDRGLIDLDAPVARYLPEFAENGKEAV